MILGLFLIALLQDAPAPPAPAAQHLEAGIKAMQKYDLTQAEMELGKAIALASQSNDKTVQSQALFFLGSVTQKRMAETKNEDTRARLRTIATGHYRVSLELNPENTATMNNLAMLLTEDQKLEEAQQLIERMMPLVKVNPQRGLYADTAGDLYAAQGKAREAARYYRIAVELVGTRQMRDKLLEQLLICGRDDEDSVDQAIDYLWAAWQASELDAALTGATRALAEGRHDGDETHVLFSIIAASLARKSYLLEDDVALPFVEKLKALTCEDCALAAKAILGAYQGEVSEDGLAWWRKPVSVDDVGPVTPLEAFQQLLYAVAQRAQSADDTALAERCYRIAIDVNRSPDLKAATALATLQVNRNQSDSFNTLVANIEKRLNRIKDTEALYDYHRSIGTIYASKKIWISDNPVQSAEYHLTTADSTLTQLNQERLKAGKAQLQPNGYFKRTLAEVYSRLNQPEKRVAAILDATEAFRRTGDTFSARLTASTVPLSEVPAHSRGFYKDVISGGVIFPEAERLSIELGDRFIPIQAGLISFAGATTESEKQLAQARLRALGIPEVKQSDDTWELVLVDAGKTRSIPFKLPDFASRF